MLPWYEARARPAMGMPAISSGLLGRLMVVFFLCCGMTKSMLAEKTFSTWTLIIRSLGVCMDGSIHYLGKLHEIWISYSRVTLVTCHRHHNFSADKNAPLDARCQ